MKIYETKTAPNPRLVRMFLAEKNISMDYQEVDIQGGENLTDEYQRKASTTKVPILELDDGTCIAETFAICQYFEALHPETPLMGTTPIEKATIEMWRRRVELQFFYHVGMCFQHTTGYFKDRMNPIAEWGAEAGKLAVGALDVLEKQLADNEYVAGDNFSIADITLLCALDFARVMKIRLTESHPNLQRWYQLVSSRASAQA